LIERKIDVASVLGELLAQIAYARDNPTVARGDDQNGQALALTPSSASG
jgi:hypothetical protein